MNATYYCVCCGYDTLDEKPPGTWQICPVCFWEDDMAQFNDPNYAGGANKSSLIEARKNFEKFGASEEHLKNEVRKPKNTERRKFNWDID